MRITEPPEPPAAKVTPKVPIDAGVAAAPPVQPPVVAGPKTIPFVAANAVTKLSGTIPAMKVNGITENFADVVSKVCIDERGHVASVKLVKAMPEIADELQSNIMSWRYQPWNGPTGQPSAVCFPLTFRVVFKRAN